MSMHIKNCAIFEFEVRQILQATFNFVEKIAITLPSHTYYTLRAGYHAQPSTYLTKAY